MKARDVIGKRIVKVEHRRWYNRNARRWERDCVRITLEDGSFLYPFAYEATDEPGSTILHTGKPHA